MISPVPSVVGVLARNNKLFWCVTEPNGREHPVSAFLVIRENESNSHVKAILRGEKVVAYFPLPTHHSDDTAPAETDGTAGTSSVPVAAGAKTPSKAPVKAPAKAVVKTPTKAAPKTSAKPHEEAPETSPD